VKHSVYRVIIVDYLISMYNYFIWLFIRCAISCLNLLITPSCSPLQAEV